MPEISLKDYLAKLDSALFAGSADEVIHHCRHILQFYPKNVAAYRYLGRALIYNARYDEGSAALRRVLSVIPDDYAAHLSLSEAYDSLKRGDQAIWHLERAFEQQPNNRELIEGVRSLYRRYRSIEPKIQLTGAAVARQHIANGRYAQAIETLRGSVARTPDRVDLKLLLAHTLWKQGDEVGGAEVALDVLEVVPDCLEANVMLTELWLRENRPSDAQRYLNRVESIDPYRALELAQGEAPDDAFRLEELDYQRFAKTEAVSARPDWLTAVSGDSPAATSNEDVNAEWSRWQSGMLASPEAASPTPASTGSLNFDFNFDDLSPAETNASALKTPPPDEEVDPMQWTQAAGVEVYDEEQEVPLFEDDFDVHIEAQSPTAWMDESEEIITADRAVPVQNDDPMAWLRAENSNLIDESAPPVAAIPSAEEEVDFDFDFDFGAQGDALSAESSDVGMTPAASSQMPPSQMPDWLTTNTPETEAIDLFGDDLDAAPLDTVPDWMQSSAPENAADQPKVTGQSFGKPLGEPLNEAVTDFDLFGESASSARGSSEAFDTPSVSEPSAETPPGVPGARKGLTAMLNNANLDWLPKSQPEPEPAEDPWMSMFAEPKQPDPVSDTPDWLSALDDSPKAAPPEVEPLDADSAFAFDMPSNAAPESAPTSTDFDFTSETSPASVEFDLPSDADFDWLTGDTGEDEDRAEKPVDDTSEIGTLTNGYISAAPEQPAPAGETPDWLSEMQPEAFEPEADDGDMENERKESGETGDASPDELPDWLFEIKPEGESESSAEEQSQSADSSEFSTESSETGGFDWSSVEPKPEPEVQPTTLPNWLGGLTSGLTPEPEPEPETSALPDSLASLFDTPAVTTAAQSDASPLSEIPDWLIELQPEPAAEPEPTAEAQPEPEEDAFAALFADPHVPDSSVELTESLLPVGMGAVEHEAAPLDAEPVSADVVPAEDDFSWLTEAGESVGHEADQGQDFGVLEGEPDELFATDSEWVGDDLAASVGDQSSVTPLQPDIPQTEIPDWLSELQPAEIPLKEEPEAIPYTPFEPEPEAEAQPEPELEEDVLASLFADPHVPDSSVELTESMLPVGLGAVEHEPAPLDAEPISSDVTPAEDDFSWLTEAGEAVGHEADQGQDFGALEGEPDELFATDSEWAGDDLAATVGDQSSVVSFLDEQQAAPDDSETAAEPVSDLPSWLIEMEPEAAEPAESAESLELAAFAEPALEVESVVEAVPSDDDEFDWLSEAGELLEPAVEQPYNPEVTDEEAAAPVEEVIMPTEPARPEELAHEAAANVPDWLNAIIPGIDIDVDEGDIPVESDFVEEPGVLEHEALYAAANEGDFDWLVDIVDEETRETLPEAPPELPEAPGVKPSAPAAQSRFAFTRKPDWLKFSKAPAWLKNSPQSTPVQPQAQPPAAPTGSASTPADQAAQDDFPDWPEEDPGDMNELPDWLK